MPLSVKLITAPASEPITLAQFKTHARIDGSDEDSLISGVLIPAAREYCELRTGRAFIEQTLQLTLDCFPDEPIELPRPELLTVEEITYEDLDGDEQTVDDSNYRVCTGSTPGTVELSADGDWPTDVLESSGAVKITYTAGYSDSADDVPAGIKAAILMVAADWYQNRENMAAGDLSKPIITAVDRLLSPYWTGVLY